MFKFVKRSVVYKSEWVNLFVDKIILPNGTLIEKQHVLDIPNAVVGIVKNDKNEILMVKAYRYILNSSEWELPAGAINENEGNVKALKREVFEETGYKIKNEKELYSYYPSNGISNQVFVVIYAEVDSKEARSSSIDETEIEEVTWMKKDELKEMVANKEINDGLTLNALLYYFFEKD